LSSLGAKSCLGSFLEFLESSRYFSDIKKRIFQPFLKMNFNFKNRIITKNKISSNPSNIYIYGWNPLVEPLSKFETPPSDSIRNSRNRSPEFGGGSNSRDNSGEQLLSIRASLKESKGTVRPSAFDSSIRPPVYPQLTILCSAPAWVVFVIPNL
jgi:hypothetical protein